MWTVVELKIMSFSRKATYSNRKFGVIDRTKWLILYLFLICLFIYIYWIFDIYIYIYIIGNIGRDCICDTNIDCVCVLAAHIPLNLIGYGTHVAFSMQYDRFVLNISAYGWTSFCSKDRPHENLKHWALPPMVEAWCLWQ